MRRVPLLALLCLGAAADAATIVPPESLGALAQKAEAVVLARAAGQEVRARGPLLFTHVGFEVLETVKGPGVGLLEVEVPGGTLEDRGWLVPGAPAFRRGQVYLLFLGSTPRGTWAPAVMSYGILERVVGRDGSHLLAPLPEVAAVAPFPRPDGVLPEGVATYRELALLPHLKAVAAGQEAWDAGKVLARKEQIPLRVSALAPPGVCTYIRGTWPEPRWPYNTPNPPGTVAIYAQDTGDPSYPNAFTAVAGAVGMWMGIPNTSLDLVYGGSISYTLPCTGQQDNPGPNDRVVVFNDPCGDIADLNGCSGTLAFGGPWYGSAHTFDGMTWYSIISWFVVVNNGAGCIGTPGYQRMLAHEMGHGLGFGHYADPGALMYYMCCNAINATDTLCAQYTYPGGGPPPTPTPTPTPTRTPTPTPTRTPTPGPSPSPTPTPNPTPTPGPTPTPTHTPTPAPTPTRTPTPTPSPTPVAAPVANFSFSPAAPFTGDTVQFTNTSTGLYTSSSWNFGDGSTSAQTHPAHTYANPGTYTVTLTVSGPGGSSHAQKPVVVRQPQAPSVVSVIARVAGIGTPWRSDVVLTNPTSRLLPLTLEYRRSGSGTAVTRTLVLGPRQARLYEDAVASLFGQGDGRGSLVVIPPREGPPPAVFSRTFSSEGHKRLGQGISVAEPLPPGTYVITGLFEDSQFRTNVGVTAGPAGLTASFELYRGSQGKVAGPSSQHVGPYDQQQWRLSELFPGMAQDGVPMTLRVTLSAPGLPWASVVDQTSHDAVYLAGSGPTTVILVPVVASVQGVVFWDTDLSLANLNGTTAVVSLEFLPENRNNQAGGTVTKTLTLGPWETRSVGRLFATLLGSSNTKGSLSVVASQPLAASCRIYTPTPAGTYGQGIPVLPVTAFSSQAKVVTGVRARDGYRTNVGLIAPSGGVNATARLYDASGAQLAERNDVYIPPRSLQQFRLEDLFPGAPAPDPVGSLEVIPNGPLGVYLSVVDGSSQDPVLVLQP